MMGFAFGSTILRAAATGNWATFMRLALTGLLLSLCLWASTSSGLAAAAPAALREDCDEACHSWLIEDSAREILADVRISFSGSTLRVRYGAGWLRGEPCPRGRRELARSIVGFKHSSAFLTRLFDQGFCPRTTLNETSGDAPYLLSSEWNTIVFDAQRARLLTRDQFAQWVVPAIRRTLASQQASRWQALRLFVDADVQYADLLTVEIGDLLADPAPSDQGTRDGDSSKAVNVVWMAGAVTANSDLVDALLNNMDADPSLATRPGYRRLISNLAGLSSSMPTRGSPPVCANVDRIARHLGWGADFSQDAKFLATLSRCERGSENLLRRSLSDPRAGVVATAIRVWWAAATNGHAMARALAPDVVKLVTSDAIPTTGALPILLSQGPAQVQIKEGTATEDVALGLAKLGLLSETVDRLLALGKADQARALLQGLEQGIHRKL
jgi:hypothetical protein